MIFISERIALPNFKQRFAADIFLASLLVGENAFRSREYERAVSVAYRDDFPCALVETTTRLRDTLHALNRRLTCIRVLEYDIDRLADLLPFLLNFRNKTEVLQLFCDSHLEC